MIIFLWEYCNFRTSELKWSEFKVVNFETLKYCNFKFIKLWKWLFSESDPWHFSFCFDLFVIKLNCKKLFRNIFLLSDYLSRQVLVQSHQQIFLIVVMNTLKMSNHDTGIASFEVILKFLLFRSYSELECFFIFIFELNLKFFENLSWLLDIYAGFQVM